MSPSVIHILIPKSTISLRNCKDEPVKPILASKKDIITATLHNQLAALYVSDVLGYSCSSIENYIVNTFFEGILVSFEEVTSERILLNVLREPLTKSFRYFETMFESNMLESQNCEVELHDVSIVDLLHTFHHVDHILDSCALCTYQHDLAMLFNLLDTSVYLQNTYIYDMAMDYMYENISPANCLEALVVSFRYLATRTYSKALRYALFYTEVQIVKLTENFGKYVNLQNQEIIQYYISHPMLNRSNLKRESTTWLLDPKNILSSFVKRDAHDQVAPHRSLKIEMESRGALASHMLSLRDQSALLMAVELVELRNHRGDKIIGYHYCTIDEKIYVSGGEIGLGRGTWNWEIYEIDTIVRNVAVVGRLPEVRRHHQSCCTRSTLFIAGGHDKYRSKRYEVFRFSINSGCESSRLPSLDFMVDQMGVDEDETVLVAVCDDTTYILELDNLSKGWKVASGRYPSSLVFTDGKISQPGTVWYPDFSLPKLNDIL